MNPVFVTGGTGYLGRPFIEELLARGCEVHALVRHVVLRRDPRLRSLHGRGPRDPEWGFRLASPTCLRECQALGFTGMMTNTTPGSAVVVRFVDGRILKGTTNDFAPLKAVFHLAVRDNPAARALPVPIQQLKGVFFVRSYEGNPKHVEDRDLAKAKGQGRKILVTFADGEVLGGFTTGYSKDKQGFFVIPADPKTNNSRVYVVTAAVKKIEWADAPAPVRVGA